MKNLTDLAVLADKCPIMFVHLVKIKVMDAIFLIIELSGANLLKRKLFPDMWLNSFPGTHFSDS